MSGASVELLVLCEICRAFEAGWGLFTLQKSMLLTPLLPRAGPTGGLGLAWPAPTMSFTIESVVTFFCAIAREKKYLVVVPGMK